MAKVTASNEPTPSRTYRKLPCLPLFNSAAAEKPLGSESTRKYGHTTKLSLCRLKLEIGETLTAIRRALLKVSLRTPSISARQQPKSVDSEVLVNHFPPFLRPCSIRMPVLVLESHMLCVNQVLHIEKRFAGLHHRVTLLERDGEAAVETMATEFSLLEDLVHALAEQGRGDEDDFWVVAKNSRFSVDRSQARLCSEWFQAVLNSGMREEAQNEVHLDDVDAATCNILRLAIALGPEKIRAIQLPVIGASCETLVDAVALAHRLLMPWMASSVAAKFAAQFRQTFLGPRAREAGLSLSLLKTQGKRSDLFSFSFSFFFSFISCSLCAQVIKCGTMDWPSP